MLIVPFNRYRDNYCGNIKAPIELIEYGDFQSEECAYLFCQIKMLQDTMGDKLRFIFRHFPMLNVHPLAYEAAIACEAAALQHKFWNMHDMIYQNQGALSLQLLIDLADDIYVDLESYKSNCENENFFKKILYDFNSGVQSGITNTPALFLNGVSYSGKQDFKALYNICRGMLFLQS